MGFSLVRRPSKPRRHSLIVEMLRSQHALWTSDALRAMIASGQLPDDYIEGAARTIADTPELWFVSDEEFIAGVRDVDSAAADVFATPEGIAFMHRMSIAIAAKGAELKVRSLFGMGE